MQPNRKPKPTDSHGSGFPVRAAVVVCLILILGLFALRLGGHVTFKADSVDISGPAPDASSTPRIVQRADASGNDARALNAAGSVNAGSASAPKERANVSQEAYARGNGAQAVNAGGDINLK